ICPKCGCDDQSMIEPAVLPKAQSLKSKAFFCNNCSHDWTLGVHRPPRYRSLDDLIEHTGLRRDEVVTLADIGALNSFGYDRRSALWQAERAVRPAGEMFTTFNAEFADPADLAESVDQIDAAPSPEPRVPTIEPLTPDPQPLAPDPCPLRPMTESERLVADYAGTGLTV